MAEFSMVLILNDSNVDFGIEFHNATDYGFVLEGEVTFNELPPQAIDLHIKPHDNERWKRFPFDTINDYPHFELKIYKQSTQGLEADFFVKIKPKPKHLLQSMSLSDGSVHKGKKYYLWSEKDLDSQKIQIPSPKKHIRRETVKPEKKVFNDLSQLAFFKQELDLHAENLFDDLSKVRPDEIYRKQISAFNHYLDKAIEMGVDRVFIIHGIGSGRLRKGIHQKLSHHPYVSHFSNTYHPKYGFGATEVLFQ
ncbi:Smr/MutS family protein [Membranihabitans marinus]|uniref:Smr/MutS family protein n=1 Tax=Membranihabitans marinus TaxID=1227546 RepID=UPI001F2C593C|nr:Smr/MutS family protein [Membranihabitans marinus]